MKKTRVILAFALIVVAVFFNISISSNDISNENLITLNSITSANAQDSESSLCPSGQVLVQRTVKNYKLKYRETNWMGTVFNTHTYMDRLDCEDKKCYTATEDGTCTFTECKNI